MVLNLFWCKIISFYQKQIDSLCKTLSPQTVSHVPSCFLGPSLTRNNISCKSDALALARRPFPFRDWKIDLSKQPHCRIIHFLKIVFAIFICKNQYRIAFCLFADVNVFCKGSWTWPNRLRHPFQTAFSKEFDLRESCNCRITHFWRPCVFLKRCSRLHKTLGSEKQYFREFRLQFTYAKAKPIVWLR